MLFRMLNRFRSDPLRAEVEASIRAGTFLHKGEWLLTEGVRSAAIRPSERGDRRVVPRTDAGH